MIVEKGFSKSGNKAVIELNGEKYFSTQEVARILGVSRGTFYAMKDRLNLEGIRVGKRKYFNERELTRVVFGNKDEGK
jgi:excisionase family DNA binding protein